MFFLPCGFGFDLDLNVIDLDLELDLNVVDLELDLNEMIWN